MILARYALALLVACLPALAPAADPVSVELDTIRHRQAALSITGPGGEATYSPAQLEEMGAMRMITRTPWRDEEAAFDGVLLSELLDAHGLLEATAIRVIAENDYAVVLPNMVWKNWPVLVATRVNGRAHTRRERGPIQFVLPMSNDARVGEGDLVNYWVWMAARIEAVE